MINVKCKTCFDKGCTKQPSFNFLGLKQALYCKEHKNIDMIDVLNKICLFEGCKKHSSFNNPGEKQGLYCKKHIKLGMVNVKNISFIEKGYRKNQTNQKEKQGNRMSPKTCCFNECKNQTI